VSIEAPPWLARGAQGLTLDIGGLRARYRPGNTRDFDELYRQTYQRIFATLAMILKDRAGAEDATQEAYLRAFRAWTGWKQDAPAEAWLHRIALNVAFSQRRREQLREVGKLVLRLGRPGEADPTAGFHPELWRELRALPSKQAAAIVLRHLHGYSNREIGLTLGVPEATVASRLAAAKARLRARLGDQVED
jgi:RNA polymerase sigma factor (sigma-70 family)